MGMSDLFRSAGFDLQGDLDGLPFETVAASPRAEIVLDARDGSLWHFDFTDAPDADDDGPLYDAPVRPATEDEVRAMNHDPKERPDG